MKVVDPAGKTWRVSRRWLPWRRRTKWLMDWLPTTGTTGRLDGLGDDPISMIIFVLWLIIVLPILLFSSIIMAIVAVELLILWLILPFAILWRMALGRHWYVEARDGWTYAWEQDGGSWSASGQLIQHVAEGIRQGMPPWAAAHPRQHPEMPLGQPPPGQPPSPV